ncbi:MAG TPA: class E sortase [Acidimicrobiales bacterium]
MSPGLRIALVVGLTLLTIGIAVLGFVPYALFVTYQVAESAQVELHHSLPVVSRPGSIVPSQAILKSVRFATPPTLPWPTNVPIGSAIATLSIPAAGVSNDVVVEGTNELQLESGPGHYASTPLPGQSGNVAIAGHRTTWLRPFYNLQAAIVGDPITLRVGSVVFHYSVTQSFTVAPSNTSVIEPLRGWWLTLTTCNPRYSAAQRLVVRARLTSVDELVPVVDHTQRATPPARVTVAAPPSALPSPPPAVLIGWLVAAAALLVVTFRRAIRSRVYLFGFLPAAACLYEAYGAAVHLIPGGW